jgi:hypothetical protein
MGAVIAQSSGCSSAAALSYYVARLDHQKVELGLPVRVRSTACRSSACRSSSAVVGALIGGAIAH